MESLSTSVEYITSVMLSTKKPKELSTIHVTIEMVSELNKNIYVYTIQQQQQQDSVFLFINIEQSFLKCHFFIPL